MNHLKKIILLQLIGFFIIPNILIAMRRTSIKSSETEILVPVTPPSEFERIPGTPSSESESMVPGSPEEKEAAAFRAQLLRQKLEQEKKKREQQSAKKKSAMQRKQPRKKQKKDD